jgi:hypothetical protein
MMPLVFEALVSAQSCTNQVDEAGVAGNVKVPAVVKAVPAATTLSEPGAVLGTVVWSALLSMKKRTRKVEPVVLVPELVMVPENVTGVPTVADVGETVLATRSGISAPVTAARSLCESPARECTPPEKVKLRPAITTTAIPENARSFVLTYVVYGAPLFHA